MSMPTVFMTEPGIVASNEIRLSFKSLGDINMWTKPAATEMRFGFEVTMYVCNR